MYGCAVCKNGVERENAQRVEVLLTNWNKVTSQWKKTTLLCYLCPVCVELYKDEKTNLYEKVKPSAPRSVKDVSAGTLPASRAF